MKFLSLLGRRLKDDDVIDVLECAQIEVIFDFDRLHENTPDRYWAASKKEGFQFEFDADQILQVIFLYVSPSEGFSPVVQSDCDVPFFSTIDEAEAHGTERKLRVTRGEAVLLGIRRDWVRLEYETRSIHYEFRNRQLALVTITLLVGCREPIMAPFSDTDMDRLDWQLMQNGAVTLYFQTAILEDDLAWLREHGYQIETIDCRDLAEFQHQMSRALKFKEQFGYDEWTGNLNALNDAFGLDFEGGLVLCFTRYDLLKAASPDFAQGVLDILESNSRDHLLFGRRLLALVQSDDPRIQFDPLGARAACWNRREWLNKNRGL